MSVAEDIEIERGKLNHKPFLPLKATDNPGRLEGIWLDEYARSSVLVHETIPPRDHHVFSISLDHTDYMYQHRLGETHEGPASAGYSAITPAGADCGFGGFTPSIVILRMTCERFDEAFEHLRKAGSSGPCRLTNQFMLDDRYMANIGHMLSIQLNLPSHPAKGLIIESLSVALAMHSVRNYSDFAASLSTHHSETNDRAIRRVLSYLEEVEHRDVSLSSLAEIAGISRFHFSRVFKAYVGLSPAQYVERSLMERAKRLIIKGNLRSIDVASAIGFSDQSHFIRRFKHHVGCTPAVFSREGGARRSYS